jgi:membrane fusion protein (multidrug efflux system)
LHLVLVAMMTQNRTKQFRRSPSQTGCIRLLAAILIAIFSASGCESEQAAPPRSEPPEVATITVRPQPVVLTTELPGRTSAYRVADIRPQVNGLIEKRLFTEGVDVKAGATLYQIDPAPFRAALESAKAALIKAEANLPAVQQRVERYGELLDEKAVSQQDYDDAAAALKQAAAEVQYWKAAVQTARINLAYTRITAPISGRTGLSSVTEGAIVTAYQPQVLVTIQQLDPMYVDVTQSSNDLLRLKRHLEDGRLNQSGRNENKVKLFLEDGTVYPLDGTLQFRDVTVNPTTGSVILRVVLPNPDGILLPGMFVRAAIHEGVNEQAILIPQQAISRDTKGNPVILIVDADEKVRQRMLEIDRAVGDQWLVTSGLASGDRIVVEGMQKVRPGTVVRAVPFESASSGGSAKTGGNALASPAD